MSEHAAPAMQADPAGECIKETERQRIARDLHDDLGSRLSAIKMALAQLGRQLPPPQDNPVLHEQAQYADRLIDEAIDAMHGIIDDLHPAVLDLGLHAALEWLAKSAARQSGIPHRLQASGDLADESWDILLDDFQTVSLYRIAREALHNAVQHAAADQVELRLNWDGKQVQLAIADNGTGMPADAAARPDASGIRGMQQRAAAIGASLQFQRGEHGGATLLVTLAVTAAAKLIK